MADDTENLIAQLQQRLEALEGKNQYGDGEFIAAQHDAVAIAKAKQQLFLKSLKRDVRPQIARGYGYKPDNDFPSDTYKPYPCWVHMEDGSSVIANNKYEHDKLLGLKAAPAKATVIDLAEVEQAQPEVRQKRKYTKRAKPVELPADLK